MIVYENFKSKYFNEVVQKTIFTTSFYIDSNH